MNTEVPHLAMSNLDVGDAAARVRVAMPEPSGALLAGIVAALQHPVLLDSRAVDAVCSAAPFYARTAMAAALSAPAAAPDPFERAGDVAIVAIDGPLAQRAWSCMGIFEGDGYDAITERVTTALADKKVAAVVLRIDSPGGEVAGCFEAVRAIRAAADAAGKPIVAFADELMASAAYALACSADEIIAPDTALVGSIGVIAVYGDRTEANKARGLNMQVVRSGDLKAAGHPDAPLTEDTVAHLQGQIDSLANIFADTVREARGIKNPLGLDGALFVAGDALKNKLIDSIGNLASAVARARELASPPSTGRAAANAGVSLMLEPIIALLGLKADATEADALAAISRQKSDLSGLLSSVEKTDPAEALGAIEGLKANAARVPALEASVKEKSDALEANERAEILKAGVAGGKITPAMQADEDWKAMTAAMSVSTLRAYVKTLARAIPLGEEHESAANGAASTKSASAELAAIVKKGREQGWDALSPREMHVLYHGDHDTYEELKAAADKG
jgi:signal peptide peptidase SppA